MLCPMARLKAIVLFVEAMVIVFVEKLVLLCGFVEFMDHMLALYGVALPKAARLIVRESFVAFFASLLSAIIATAAQTHTKSPIL